MKSLLISSTYFPPQVGGISQSMASIASALGPEHVCCLTAVNSNETCISNALRPRVYRRPAALGRVRHLHALAWGVTISEVLIRERPRIVQLATADDGYLGLWLRRWLHLPFVVYAHGNEILAAMQGGWHKPLLALRTADRVLANSRFTADLVRKAGIAPDRIETTFLGCDVERFRPAPGNPELRRRLLGSRYTDRVILTVANLVARKGHDVVLRALPLVRQSIPGVTYLIVGDGPYRAHLEELSATLGVQEHVIFASHVDDADLREIYAVSDVFVMPSRANVESCDVEGFGLVFLEASACGKPVIGGRSGGIPDAIEDGTTGLLVDPHDAEDVAHALVRVLTDQELATHLGEQGRLRVVRDFTWEKIGKRIQGILDSVVREKRR